MLGTARLPNPQPEHNIALLGTAHRPKTKSHINALPPDQAAAAMHRRLHINPHKLRSLPDITADAPASLSKSSPTSCPHCVEANATHAPHRGQGYTSSHPGRLVHADIAGPFI